MDTAPGNEFVKLRSVRVVNKELHTVDTIDIRQPVGIEMVFAILNNKYSLIPCIVLYNDNGVRIFNAIDTDPACLEQRGLGNYTVTAWIPGNLLSEGTMIVNVLIITPLSGTSMRHVNEAEVTAFQVIDPGEGDSARGVLTSHWGGACRPLLRWTTTRS
jgi:lipopolysaccharide transport system ATP-binding protein